MIIKKLLLNNIRTYENQEISFPEGTILLSGDIGSGKSSVLLAIEFALFGLQKGKSGSMLLRNGAKEGFVKLEFEIDKNKIEIERRLKRAKEGVQQDRIELRINGIKEDLSSTEIKNRILSMLNYPSEFLTKNPILYRFTVYTPQEEMKTILVEDEEVRLNVLRRVFGIDKYKRIIENTEKVTGKIREEIKSKEGRIYNLSENKNTLESKREEIKKIKGEIAVLKTKHEEIKKISDERRINLEEAERSIKDLNTLRTDFARKESEIKEKKLSLRRNDFEIEELKKRVLALEKELAGKELISEEEVLKEMLRKENEIKENETLFLQANKKVMALELEKDRNTRISRSILELDTCPTCKQNVPENYKKDIKSKTDSETEKIVADLKREIAEKEKFSEILMKLKNEVVCLRNKDKEISLTKFKLNNLKESREKEKKLLDNSGVFGEEIKKLEAEAYELQARLDVFKDAEKTYEIAKRMLEEIRNEERVIEISKARFERQFEDYDILIANLEKEIAEKEKIKDEIIYLKRMKEWLSEQFVSAVSEIEKNVMLKVHAEFSELFGKWFAILAEGLSARVDETFAPIIEQQGYSIEYSYLSGGERTAAALAYRLALNQVINSIMSEIKTRDILILDEPTDGFSSEQLDKMREVLKELKVKQLILVSHEQKVESFVNNIIRFEKKNGITKI